MNLIVDFGGTHIRFLYNNKFIKKKHDIKSIKEFIFELEDYVKYLEINEEFINKIIIALPGIIDDFIIHNETNLKFLNNISLPKKILNYEAIYFNDGDLSLLGEINYNKIDKSKKILNLIFGTGVGCGLWINNLIENSEANKIFEDYLGGKNIEKLVVNNKKTNLENLDDSWVEWYFGKEDMIYNKIINNESIKNNESNNSKENIISEHLLNFKNKFIDDLSNLIELLNLDVIVINGFLKEYDIIKLDINDLRVNSYFKKKIKIIYSDCIEPVLEGGKYM